MEQNQDINLLDFHKIGSNGNPYDIIDDRIANYIIQHEYIIVIAGKPYIYKNGFYKKDADGNILRYLIKSMILEELRTITKINRVYGLIISNHKLKRDIDEINRHPVHWINFRNGMYDTMGMKMQKHKPEYLSINQIPHEYKGESRENSVISEFLEGIMPNEEDRQMFLEFAGYCMTVDTGLQKFLVINGVGGTGKSTIIRLVCSVIGKENISNLSLQDLNERFSATNIFGKTLNACADIPSKAMEQVDIIKKLTGEDTIKGEYKGGDVFFFNSYAKLLFSANQIPISLDDKTNAYYRRFLIIEVGKRCHEIPELEKRLQEDVQTFIDMAVKAVHEMYMRGNIIESQNSKESVLELYKASDSVQAFIVDRLEVDVSGKIERRKLYQSYESYCEDSGRTPVTANGFYKNLREKGYTGAKVLGERYFKGLAYQDAEFEPFLETPFEQGQFSHN